MFGWGLKKRVEELEVAYNELFDAVAEDLGYTAMNSGFFGYTGFHFTKSNPRRIAKTTPKLPEVLRSPTTRCKGKK